MDKRDKHGSATSPWGWRPAELPLTFQWDEEDKSSREMDKKGRRKYYIPCEYPYPKSCGGRKNQESGEGVFGDGDELFVLRTSWNSQDKVVEVSLGATGTDPFPEGSLAAEGGGQRWQGVGHGYKCPHSHQEALESSSQLPKLPESL